MIALEAAKPGSFSKDAILWLKRWFLGLQRGKSFQLDDLDNLQSSIHPLVPNLSFQTSSRALQLIEKFFSNILDDGTCQESLKSHIKEAYMVTLKPHHNWIAQQGFSVKISFHLFPLAFRILIGHSAGDLSSHSVPFDVGRQWCHPLGQYEIAGVLPPADAGAFTANWRDVGRFEGGKGSTSVACILRFGFSLWWFSW